jgi:hypothetical protein
MDDEARSSSFLPRDDHLAYLANLLTVLAILYAAWYLHRGRRATKKGNVPGGPGAGGFAWGT